jgi:hypothetical protein
MRRSAARTGTNEPFYSLLEEASESWDHTISHELPYLREPIKITRNVLGRVRGEFAEHYINGNIRIDCHITLKLQGNAYHLLVVVEFQDRRKGFRNSGKMKHGMLAVDGNPSMLVNVAQLI